jgi:hypothetical protein
LSGEGYHLQFQSAYQWIENCLRILFQARHPSVVTLCTNFPYSKIQANTCPSSVVPALSVPGLLKLLNVSSWKIPIEPLREYVFVGHRGTAAEDTGHDLILRIGGDSHMLYRGWRWCPSLSRASRPRPGSRA